MFVSQLIRNINDSAGKMIGVISRMEALKERVPIQICVEKKARGSSSLRVLPA